MRGSPDNGSSPCGSECSSRRGPGFARKNRGGRKCRPWPQRRHHLYRRPGLPGRRLLRLAGASPSTERVIDGKDIWPLVSAQQDAKTPHEAFFYYVGNELQALRSGKWKLHFPHRYRTRFINRAREIQDPRAVRKIGLALFDLKTDVAEQYDVAAHYPEVVARLTALAEKCRAELGDSRQKRDGGGVRPPGRV